MEEMGLMHLWSSADFVAKFVFVVVLIMFVGTVWYIGTASMRNFSVRSHAHKVIDTFWQTTNPQEAIRAMESQPANEPFSKIALECANAAAHHAKNEGSRLVEALNRSEFIDRALRQAVSRESAKLENGLTWLASVGSTAPFVGLFGTVWGIYNALIKIGASGQASLDVVAGPVGEALIMTCIGLGVAIPSVLAYNFFVRANRVTLGQFDEFAHDLHDYFATGARVGGGPQPTMRVQAPAAARPAAGKA
ncbi:MAG TPA: MotA/TolQ/ExbB proton channel family protein [Xanthomonadales bacterium]|nr:MotA/TolQ/ExbB proton channel family protein [Xanthomonadales bacterium]